MNDTIQKSKKRFSKEEFQKVFARLRELYPKVFSQKEALPLKIGSYEDILNDKDFEESPEILKTILRSHTKSFSYLKAVCKLKCRYDLQGNKVEEVSAEHLKQSQDFLNFKKKQGQKKTDKDSKVRAEGSGEEKAKASSDNKELEVKKREEKLLKK